MSTWRHGEAESWETVEDGRESSFEHLETRARREWAELHKRQEEMRQRLDRESRTMLGRLWIWRLDRSLWELAGAIRGREDLVEVRHTVSSRGRPTQSFPLNPHRVSAVAGSTTAAAADPPT